jgi:hypothetical protein
LELANIVPPPLCAQVYTRKRWITNSADDRVAYDS